MATKIEKLCRAINDAFRDKLHAALANKFPGLTVESEYSIVAMAMVTRPTSRKKFTRKQYDFIGAYEAGYFAAKAMVRE